jgi:hypothetical protein
MTTKRKARRAAPQLEAGEVLVLTIPEAGRLIGLSRWSAYSAASRGEIPTIKLGRRLVVPKVALMRMLDGAGERAKSLAAAVA